MQLHRQPIGSTTVPWIGNSGWAGATVQGSHVLQHTNCQEAPPDQDMGTVTATVDLPNISGGTYDAKSGVVSLSSSSETGDCDSVLAGPIGDASPMLAFNATPWDQFASPMTMSCDGSSNLSMNLQVPGQAAASP